MSNFQFHEIKDNYFILFSRFKNTIIFFQPFFNSGSEEWQYFISKKIQPIHQQYVSGYLAKLPTEMDEFWAECYEMSKVLTHKRSREIGESKLKFQSKYQEPYTALRKIENTRYNNVLGQLLSHSSFIKRRWLMAKRQFFGPRGAWSDENTGKKINFMLAKIKKNE